MNNRFENKTILVTGASSGIGQETAIQISQEGGCVVLVGRDENRLQETIKKMKNPEKHHWISFDLMEIEKYKELFRILKEKQIVLNGLVHCAGVTAILPLRAMNFNNSLDLFKIHYFSFVELIKHYAKKGVSEGGSIVAISAINAHTPQKCMTAYASAKAAVETACRTLSLELIEKNIRINSVVVGSVETKMSENAGAILQSLHTDYENPVVRQLIDTATPDQIAKPILFLLSDDASYITGRELYADGGLL